jgi:hypothetical protein
MENFKIKDNKNKTIELLLNEKKIKIYIQKE